MPYARDLYKTKMCSLYIQRGYCPRQSCSFAHGESELRKVPGEALELTFLSFFPLSSAGDKVTNGDRLILLSAAISNLTAKLVSTAGESLSEMLCTY
jgi:hypothetical protein